MDVHVPPLQHIGKTPAPPACINAPPRMLPPEEKVQKAAGVPLQVVVEQVSTQGPGDREGCKSREALEMPM